MTWSRTKPSWLESNYDSHSGCTLCWTWHIIPLCAIQVYSRSLESNASSRSIWLELIWNSSTKLGAPQGALVTMAPTHIHFHIAIVYIIHIDINRQVIILQYRIPSRSLAIPQSRACTTERGNNKHRVLIVKRKKSPLVMLRFSLCDLNGKGLLDFRNFEFQFITYTNTSCHLLGKTD